jgi:hypothetical protein
MENGAQWTNGRVGACRICKGSPRMGGRTKALSGAEVREKRGVKGLSY